MEVVFTRRASRQLAEILDYIAERNPTGARAVQARIRACVEMLADFPEAGAPTDEPMTRRIEVTPHPYAIFYQIRDVSLIIERIRHTARRPL